MKGNIFRILGNKIMKEKLKINADYDKIKVWQKEVDEQLKKNRI